MAVPLFLASDNNESSYIELVSAEMIEMIPAATHEDFNSSKMHFQIQFSSYSHMHFQSSIFSFRGSSLYCERE